MTRNAKPISFNVFQFAVKACQKICNQPSYWFRDEPRIRRAIATATSESIDAETTVDWILADNAVRATTRRDLEQVLAAKSMREQLIFQKYREWRATDKQEPFSY
ncbi:hypothetical protein ACEOHO_004129 [Vibrio vulnificus]